jgi:hypothetical protein
MGPTGATGATGPADTRVLEAITAIADPSSATTEEIATTVNTLLGALQSAGIMSAS